MTIQFRDYPAVNSDSDDKTLYGDIIVHCKDWKHYAEAGSRYTTAHECTHGVNNDLRLASGDWQGKNGFYVGKDRAVVLDEPEIKKADIIPFIPQELRSARYNLYVAGQKTWDDKPLYIYDEGVAYINGAWAAIELKEQENYVEGYRVVGCNPLLKKSSKYGGVAMRTGGNTIVDGHVEFIPYMAAVLMAAHKRTSLLAPDLVDFSRWLFRHACNAYYRCLKNFPSFDVQDKLWGTMSGGECFAEHRKFLEEVVGFVFPSGEVPEEDSDPWFP